MTDQPPIGKAGSLGRDLFVKKTTANLLAVAEEISIVYPSKMCMISPMLSSSNWPILKVTGRTFNHLSRFSFCWGLRLVS